MLDIHCVTTVLSIPKLNCASKKDSIMLLFPSLYTHTYIYTPSIYNLDLGLSLSFMKSLAPSKVELSPTTST